MKIKKLLFAAMLLLMASCNSKVEDSSVDMHSDCTLYPVSYEDINEVDDLVTYQGEVTTNLPVSNGIIVSPYYSLNINGIEIPVYATRVTNTIHSFAYVDVEAAEEFNLDVSLSFKEKNSLYDGYKTKVVVLPESKNVTANVENNVVTASINKLGSYSFAFNKKQDLAFTLFLTAKQDEETLFAGKDIIYIEPNDYATDLKEQTLFTEENKVYYFKKGRYKVDRISLPSNCILYLQSGAYLEVIPTTSNSFIYNTGINNIQVLGRGLIDYSACCGGEVPEPYYSNKGGLSFADATNVKFAGITVINSQTWTLCFTDCKEVEVENILFFGYRVYSDGVMLSDCKNGYVHDSFIRTGDDAFETKSTSGKGLTENVLFKNNAAWTDKAVAYGCIYESNHDTSDVHFEDCSVGFALGTWSNHLGCCVIQMGNRKGATMHDITFNNFEVYMNYNPALLNVYIGGSGGQGAGYGIVKDIYFSNITCHRNYGAYLNIRTYDSENCAIYALYLDNIVANDILLTNDNYETEGYITDHVVGGYNYKYLKINTKSEEE